MGANKTGDKKDKQDLSTYKDKIEKRMQEIVYENNLLT